MARSNTRRAGQGSTYQRKDGRWEGAITVGYNENGNAKRIRVIKPTRSEAVNELNKVIAKLNLGVPITQGKQTLEEFTKTWLDTVIKPNSAPKTYRYYEQITRLYITPKLGRKRLDAITPQMVQAMMNELSQPRKKGEQELPPLKTHTLNGIRATLRSALATARKWRLIGENPCSLVTVPKTHASEAVYLSVEETSALLARAEGHPLGNVVAIGVMTGMRLGEVTGLRWDDVDLVDKSLRVRGQLQFQNKEFVLRAPKSNSGRRLVPLHDEAVQVLQDQRARQMLWAASAEAEPFNAMGLVFTTCDGKPLHQKSVDKALKKLALEAKIEKPISFHKLRHTFGTLIAASGESLTVLKDLLGHSQISVTVNTYGHAVPTANRSAVEKFGAMFKTKEG